MKIYARYKDSGISWIGEIPDHWDISKIRYIVRTPLQYGANESGIEYDETLPRYIRITDITMDNRLKSDGKLSLPKDVAEPYILEDGDILFARSGASVGKTFFYENKYGCSAFAGYLIKASVNKAKVFAKYIYYNTLGNNYEEWKSRSFIQATIQNIGADKYNTYIVPIPPLEEQKSIAAYLDKKTEQVNGLVAAKQKQIELLKEYKQSLIANAVTKGINPKVKMKDSGINWIGKVPEHWSIHFLFQKAKEHYISNKNIHHQNLLSLSYGRIIQKDINTTEGLLPESFDTYQIVEDGNIVLRLTDLQNDHKSLRVGYVTQEGIITSAYECLEIMFGYFPKYLYYQLHSFDIKKMFYGMGGGLRQNLNYNELKKIRIAVPPFEEQKVIVEYIENRVSSIDSQISSIEKQIANLNEYKQSLISDVVTGKVKV